MSETADIAADRAADDRTRMAIAAPYPSREEQPYPPLRDYALIGDGHGAALVCRDGAIDWCCLGRFDASPVFARLLDAKRGGYFSLRPVTPAAASRHYLAGTAILQTEFAGDGGRAAVIDFMPMGRRPLKGPHDYTSVNAPDWIVRIVKGVSGRLDFRAVYRPMKSFGAPRAALSASDGCVTGEGVPALHGTAAFSVNGAEAEAAFAVEAGDLHCFILAPAPLARTDLLDEALRMLDITTAYWREWIEYCTYSGPHAEAVIRSAITLKLLIYSPSGAIVAAPTTSLPEALGGERNWDYRFCWVRDSCFTLYSMAALGFVGESRRFVDFLKAARFGNGGVHLMYGVGGETDLTEHDLEDFAGYRDSRPVRIGNAAHQQLQLDLYGEYLDFAMLYAALGGSFDEEEKAVLTEIADLAAARWREPDNGIWEMRRERQHFVHSKIMCWVAVDRAIRLFGSTERWERARRDIVEAVLRDGIDPETGALVQVFGGKNADSSLLMTPWLGFPVGVGTIRRTLEKVMRELREGEFLRRYAVHDGLSSREGAFLMASFWLTDALLFVGETRVAEDLLSSLVKKANDVGLFSEEIDPRSEAFLGNMPQALVHLAVMHSALRQALYHKGGHAALTGSFADRARRSIAPTAGPGAWWTAVKQSARVWRIAASRRSLLPMP